MLARTLWCKREFPDAFFVTKRLIENDVRKGDFEDQTAGSPPFDSHGHECLCIEVEAAGACRSGERLPLGKRARITVQLSADANGGGASRHSSREAQLLKPRL